MKTGMVYWGDRPALWSVAEQKILAEEEFDYQKELIDCMIMKLPIKHFGKKADNIKKLYPDAKVLVFANEPWQAVAMKGVSLNENIIYTLAKWRNEYVILSSKRVGELMMRTGSKFKKLLTFTGDALDEMVLEHPVRELKTEVPVLIDNSVTSDFGTGINAIIPGHDIDSLQLAFHYGIPTMGHVDLNGKFTSDLGDFYAGLDALIPETNKYVASMFEQEGYLFCQFPY